MWGRFPAQKGTLKEKNFKLGLNKWEFDVFGHVETNLDWRLLQEDEKFPLRSKEWWETQHISWSHNRTTPPRQVRQFGGTALFSIHKAAHRVIEKGMDVSNLGRWTWTRYKGRGNQTLNIMVAYRPNPPQGPYTVYAQHNAYFHSIQRDICPREAFLKDLTKEVTKIKEKGDHLILLLDGNSNMINSNLATALTQNNLSEVILDRHGTDGPETHKRNSNKSPIFCI